MVRGRWQSATVGLLVLVSGAVAACAAKKPPPTIAPPDAELRAALASLSARTDELERKVAALGKRVGTPRAAGASRSLEQRLAAIEDRLDAGEQSRTAGEVRSAPPPRPAPTAAPELDVDGLQRESARELPSAYQHGLTLVRDGAYDQAIQALREFARARNGSAYVAGAHYWIGQAHMQLGQFYQAILAFTEVQQRFAGSAYAPAAGLASGAAFLQLGNASEARRAFERVTLDYPDSPEAVKARARLAELADSKP
jgi:tol-pal system protein YbgF